MKPTEQQIETAVEWWSEQVCFPKFDNGDDSETGFVAMALATMATKGTDPTPEQVEKFKATLRAALSHEGLSSYALGVDYGPTPLLYDAGEAAGISDLRWPWKTQMWLNVDGSIDVSEGYRGPVVRILEAKHE